MSEKIAMTIGRSLDWEVQQHFSRAYQAMWRELDYSIDNRKAGVLRAIANGWTRDRLRVVAVLSAFNRTVLGPLAAAMSRKEGTDLGLSRPIRYGRLLTISRETSAPVRSALDAFDLICIEIRVRSNWLHANRMNDVVYLINKERDADGQDIPF
jgi:hypothetical protein